MVFGLGLFSVVYKETKGLKLGGPFPFSSNKSYTFTSDQKKKSYTFTDQKKKSYILILQLMRFLDLMRIPLKMKSICAVAIQLQQLSFSFSKSDFFF